MYYNTASNRADNPTRGSAPKPPDLDLPRWFSELEWLAAVGAPSAGAELPFEDICGGQDLDLRPATAVKKQQSKSLNSQQPRSLVTAQGA